TDSTAQIIDAFQSDTTYIRYYRIDNSGGPARPRNVGINMARGEGVFLFDSDDLMLDGKINETLAVARSHPVVKMIFTNFRSVDECDVVLTLRFLYCYST